MKRIVVCDESVMKLIPNIMSHVYNQFGLEEVILYSYMDDRDGVGFVARRGNNCLLIDGDRIVGFALTDEDDLEKVILDDRVYSFAGDKVYMANASNGNEYALSLEPLEKEDEDTPEALATYTQYSAANDTICDLKFVHVYRPHNGFAPLYDYHLRDIESFYIDEQFTKKGNNHGMGILPIRCKYYGKYDIYVDTLQYEFVAIRDFGLLNVLANGSYNLIRDDKVVRYIKAQFVDSRGDYRDLFPLTKTLTKEEALELLTSYGFHTSVPSEMVSIYNHINRDVEDAKELAILIKGLTPEEKDTKRMRLQIQK